MKSVMISIQPQWVEKILNGVKTVEIRKNAPKLKPPFKCYIYCTQPKPGKSHQYDAFGLNGKPVECGGYVVAEFVCDKILPIRVFNNGTIQDWNRNNLKDSCVPYDDIVMYIGNNCSGYGWHISDLKVYDKPKELSNFEKHDNTRPCENGNYCEYDYFDYSENTQACRIDFCGDECPFVKMQRPPQSWCYVWDME